MKPYILELLDTSSIYKALVIGTTSESLFTYWEELLGELRQVGVVGKVLFDSLLHNGNNSDRYLEIDLGELDNKIALKIVSIPRDNFLRQKSSYVLASQPSIVKGSILNEYQKTLLLKKICL